MLILTFLFKNDILKRSFNHRKERQWKGPEEADVLFARDWDHLTDPKTFFARIASIPKKFAPIANPATRAGKSICSK